jgi:tetratricopeptide (TPR) repeat protein
LRTRLAADDPAAVIHQTDLALTRNMLGWHLHQQEKYREAVAEYRQAIDVRRRVEAGPKASAANRRNLAQAEHNLGLAYRAMGEPAEGAAALAHARELRAVLVADAPADAALRTALAWSVVGLANCKLDLGEAADAVALAGSVADLLSNGDPIYDAACICAKAAAAADSLVAERHAATAVALLRLAIVRGYVDVGNLLQDADLAAVRPRANFAELLWDVADQR